MKKLLPPVAAFAILAALAPAQITNESESNDSDTSADGPVGSGIVVAGDISNRWDVDWFFFDVVAPGQINVSLDHHNRVDLDIYLYPETGGWVARGATISNPETLTYSVPSDGRYYVEIISYRRSGW